MLRAMPSELESHRKAPDGLPPHVWGALSPRRVALGAFLLLTFRVFQYFPGMSVVDTAWLMTLFISFFIVYAPVKIASNGRYTYLELYIVVLMVATPICTAILAHINFNQPLIYGLLSQRWVVTGVGPLLVWCGLKYKWFSVHDLVVTFQWLGWLTLLAYIIILLLLNPANFTHVTGFVGYTSNQMPAFRFNSIFIIFNTLYYTINAVTSRKLRKYVFIVPFAVYTIINGGRSQLISMVSALLIITFFVVAKRRRVGAIVKLIVAGLLFTAFLMTTAPRYVVSTADRTSDAIDVVITGARGVDASANARVEETQLAWPYVRGHWLFGNGSLSHRWKGGFQGALGGYFFTSDIGIVGVIFEYGVVGAGAFGLQCLMAYMIGRRRDRQRGVPLVAVALMAEFVYVAMRSLATGQLVWAWQVTLTVLFMLMYLSRSAAPTRRLLARDRT